MWVRLPELTIAEKREAHRIQRRAWPRRCKIAALWTVAFLVLFALGFRGWIPRMGIVSVASVYQGPIVHILIIFPFLFLLVLPVVVIATRHDTRYSLAEGGVCKDCGKAYGATGVLHCECGQALEPYAHFKWVDDPSDGAETGG